MLNSPYYPIIRQKLQDLFNFLSNRFNVTKEQIAVTVKSNTLDIYLPGKEKITAIIQYCNPQTNLDYQYPIPEDSKSESEMGLQETPEDFGKRTGMAIIDTNILLAELFPDWILETNISVPELDKYITQNESKSNDVYLTTPNKRYRLKCSSPKKIIKVITNMVYSQRTISRVF